MNYYKKCLTCGRTKQKEKHFCKNPFSKDGYRNTCKTCEKIARDEGKNILHRELIAFLENHPYEEISYFGFRVGYIITIRKGEFLAYSLLKGSQVLKNKNQAKAWLCRKLVKAAKVIEAGLLKRLKDYDI
jgi:hypothetical protein